MVLRGFVDEITTASVHGWALDEADLRRPINVDLLVNGVQYASPRADLLREDLQRDLGYGHHAFAFEFNPPLPLFRDHHVQIRFSGTDELVPNGEHVLRGIDIASERLLQPILVTAPGRAGSTILMKRLASHLSVSVANQYPFETELLKYYGHAFAIMTAPGDHDRSGKPESFVDNKRFLGANPYNVASFSEAFTNAARFQSFYQSDVPRELAPAFRTIINKFYLGLAADQNKEAATFFAEKCQLAGMARWLGRNLFSGLREIVLIRDLRDTLCSYKAFWSHTTTDAMRLLRESGDALIRIRKEQRSDVLFVRYEDMVEQEPETLQRIAEFIGIRDFTLLDAEQELFQEHGTSKSPIASIGRWKRELSIEDVRNCVREFGAILETFGYEV